MSSEYRFLSEDEKKFIIESHSIAKNNNNLTNIYKYVSINFENKFNRNLNKMTFYRILKKWNNKSTIDNLKKGAVHKKTVRIEENILKVQNNLKEKCLTDITRASEISRTTVAKILKKDLGFKSYSPSTAQSLNENNIRKRLYFCEYFEEICQQNPDFINNVWFSDECHFEIEGKSGKNRKIYEAEKPHPENEVSAHPMYVTVWAAISAQGIIGPYFFEDKNGKHITVTKERYCEMIQNYFIPELLKIVGTENLSKQWFQQDGARPHTSDFSLKVLSEFFGNRIISDRCEFIWPPSSPDLNLCDFALWPNTKSLIYKKTKKFDKNCKSLKFSIKNTFKNLSSDFCKNCINSFMKRLKLCKIANGKHFEYKY